MVGQQRDIGRCRHQYGVDGNLQKHAQGEQIVHRGQRRPVLPFVNGLGSIKPKVVLHVLDGQTPLLAELSNVLAGGFKVDRREMLHFHRIFPPAYSVGRSYLLIASGSIIPEKACFCKGAKKLS